MLFNIFYRISIVLCACLALKLEKPEFARAQNCQRLAKVTEIAVDNDEIVKQLSWDGNGEYQLQIKNCQSLIHSPKSILRTLSLRRLATLCKATFFPVGFPNTTPSEYIVYQRWNLIQDLCSYLRGIMSTGALLEGLGVGRVEATALQATILWMYREGAGMLGSLLFTSLSSNNIGQNVKAWRLFADGINNIGITLDMIAPYFRRHFLLVMCVSSVCKALCGVAAGATGAAIAEHWGEQHGNIADVLAKNGAQHTVVSFIGLLTTVPFATFTSASPAVSGIVYGALTALHMYANWNAMRVLALRTINPARGRVILQALLQTPFVRSLCLRNDNDYDCTSQLAGAESLGDVSERLSISAVSAKERIFHFPSIWFQRSLQFENGINNVELWTPPSKIMRMFGAKNMTHALEVYRDRPYFILCSAQTGMAHVCFDRGVTGQDQLRAWLEGCLLLLILQLQGRQLPARDGMTEEIRARQLCDIIAPPFFALLRERGWKVDLPLLRPSGANAYSLSAE